MQQLTILGNFSFRKATQLYGTNLFTILQPNVTNLLRRGERVGERRGELVLLKLLNDNQTKILGGTSILGGRGLFPKCASGICVGTSNFPNEENISFLYFFVLNFCVPVLHYWQPICTVSSEM